ncbi:helix-turn-helix transcriptional regulator [Rubellimicrobium aerolatum]|uniref:PAS domain S-box protein n=1 Tax=Rubellimicrobium aerolatum TaxID=490979 RepID=A0ABW0SHH2_9RHOB|nr:PAS domain S-box-containing protein [Rubellimicrobium aerolatum]
MTDDATRAQLERIIEGLAEGVILIEPDQRISYANLAALRMHGATNLAALGDTVAAYRATYVLTDGAHRPASGRHPIERVVSGEAVDDVVVHVTRADAPEVEWAHRLRSLAMTDASGAPDLLVVIVTDVSEQVEAEARFEATFAANPAPSLICRLADQRFVKVNEGFLELTGLRRDEILGRSLHEVDVLARAERRDLALERLRAGQTIPQMEACLAVPADAEKLVIVAGQPIEMGDEPCLLFTFADLEPRRRAEAALRHSEERFVTCFRLAPVPLAVVAAKGTRFVEVNEAFCALTGLKTPDAVGRSLAEVGLWAEAGARRSFERAFAATGQVRSLETRLRTKDGAEFDALVAADAVRLGDEPSLLLAIQDVSERRRSEAELMAAIEAVMADASWFSQAVVEKLAELRHPQRTGREGAVAGLAELTGREREVLGLICRGLGNAEIGQRLKVSSNTVKNHLASLYRKLGVNRRSALIVWARERGFGDGEVPPRRTRRTSLPKD